MTMTKVDGSGPRTKGSWTNIQRTAAGGLVVTIDMCVTHHCADMAEVIELLQSLGHPVMPEKPGDGASLASPD